ncbi:MAG: TonB-dependent receptor [Nonlabens sp.]
MTRLLFFCFAFIVSWASIAQSTASIYGTVVDDYGEPILAATIVLQKTDKGTLTDLEGKYALENVTPGSYNLTASYVGYKSVTKFNILIKSVGNPAYNFKLETATESLNTVVVSDQNRISRPRETPLSTQSLSAAEIATYPGSNNDVVQVAQTLPGVSPSIGGFRNDLIIRGGAPNETVYYLDGMEVPNINHFSTQGSAGGPVGLVNVSFINEVTLSTSAFAARYDNPLSGVLQFEQRNGNSREFTGNFRVSASEAALTLEGPIFKKKDSLESNTTFLASVRRSYLQFLFKQIGLPFRPNYWDYQYKLNHKIDDYNSITLLGIGSIDDFTVEAPDEFDADQQASLEQAPFIDQQTNAIGITWRNRFKNGTGFMSATLSNNLLRNEFTRFADSENETGVLFSNNSLENETKLRYEATKFLNDWKYNVGTNLQYSYYENETFNQFDGILYDTEINFLKYGFFGNATRSFLADRLDLSLGFRMDADSFTSGNSLLSTFSPRASLSYEFTPSWILSATAGRYYKLPPYTILGFRDNTEILINKNVDYTRSDHIVLGIEHFFTPSSSVSLEGFYKWYDDYPVSILDQVSLANKGGGFEVLGNEPVATVGKGRAYGLELQFQQKLTDNFYGIFAYTFFYSEFTGFDREVFLPSVWDSRHLVSFTSGYKLPRNWEISARYRFAGETPFVPTDQGATLANYPEIVLDYSRLGEQNLEVFSQLDIRIDKKWNFDNFFLNVFIEAQNVLGQNNPQPPEYGLARNEITGIVLNPRQLVEVGADDTGTVIPSIGIVIDF